MTNESLLNEDWTNVVARLGGAETLNTTARETKAFVRPRQISNPVDLLRLILAYCLGERGLRSTAAWAASVGLVDISNVAVLYRLRQCGDWLATLVGQALATGASKASRGRMIRIIDATTVPKAGPAARKKSGLWRIHSAFDLPHERFGHFELTDQQAGETLDRIPVVKGEIRLADRPICNRTAWPSCLKAARTSSSGPAGRAHAGSMPRVVRSISSPSCMSRRHAG